MTKRELAKVRPWQAALSPIDLKDAGLSPYILSVWEKSGFYEKYARGIYTKSDEFDDEFFLLQKRYSKGIFSHETSLFLLGFGRGVPSRFTMTFPAGYHADSLSVDSTVRVIRERPEFYRLGVIYVRSPFGNPIRIHDLERTICDLFRRNNTSPDTVIPAIKEYVSYSSRDIPKLFDYAKKLHVEKRLLPYLEVLL